MKTEWIAGMPKKPGYYIFQYKGGEILEIVHVYWNQDKVPQYERLNDYANVTDIPEYHCKFPLPPF